MKKIKKLILKIFDVASIVSSTTAILATLIFVIAVFVEAFGKTPCSNLSTCYAVVIFIAGIIVTLKIRLLDEGKRWVELILFIIGSILNVLFMLSAFIYDCQGNEEAAIKILNATIWADFVIVLKSLGLVIALYFRKYVGFKKKKVKLMNGIDLFEYWLKRKDKSSFVKRALTDKSYKKENPLLKDTDVNFSLATFGDSIIKYSLSLLLLDKVDKLSEEKKKFESDEFLVKTVAEHYKIIDYIQKDTKDSKMPSDYNYSKKKGGSLHKYIATAVEAMVGAIYFETEDLEAITEMIESWTKLD